MKIAIEASTFLIKNKTGVEHFTHRLLKALFEIDPKNQYFLTYMAFANRKTPDFKLNGANIHHRRIHWLPGKLYNLSLRLPVGIPIDLVSRQKPDIFFFPNFVRWPLLYTKRSVVIVHDLGYIDYPHVLKNAHHRRYLNWAVPRSMKKATHIVAISESTKKQIMHHYAISSEKISVVTPAIEAAQYQPASSQAIAQAKQKYGIEGEYVLYLGTLEPRKNIVGIVEAYRNMPEKTRKKYKLVLAGGKGWGSDEIEAAIHTIAPDQLVRTGYIADEDIPALYSGAATFVYPSLYEGWGMQILEAMACGAPVITANNSSLPEAGGKAAAYIKTGDNAQLSQVMQEVLEDPKKRAEMTRLGKAHAKSFSWESSARVLLGVFQRLS